MKADEWYCTAHISASTGRMEVSGGVLESPWSGLSTGSMYMPQFASEGASRVHGKNMKADE